MAQAAVYDKWKDRLRPVLQIKAEEFQLLGYGGVRQDTIWEFVVEKVVRKHPDKPVQLHEFVSEMMSFSLNDYMNRLRKDSFHGPDWFEEDQPLNLDEFGEKLT